VKKALACALVMWALPAAAQLPTPFEGRSVESIRIVGESSGATSARDVGIPLGVPVSRQLLRNAVLRMLESGRWADVQIDVTARARGVELVVHLAARIVVTRVDVDGNENLGDDEISDALALGQGGELEQADLGPLHDRVAHAYAERGYADASVEMRLLDTDDPSRKVLSVTVEENEPLRVAGWVFSEESPPPGMDLPSMIGLSEGQVLDRQRLSEGLETAIAAVRALGYLEARLGEPVVTRDERGAVLTIDARFGPLYEIRIVDHAPLSRGQVEDVLDLDEERLTASQLDAIRERVIDLWRRHGYHHAEVEILRYRGEREGTAVLEIQNEHHNRLDIVGMSFPGASHFTRDYLRDQMISVIEEGMPDTRFFGPSDSYTLDRLGLGGRSVLERDRRSPRPLEVDPSRVYYGPGYERAVEHLAELYVADGYLSARIGEPTLEIVGRGRGIVTIPVFEGPRTMLFGVSLEDNVLFGDRELLQRAELERGQPFSYLALEEAIEHMTELYRERGYLYADVEYDVRFSEDRTRAAIVLRVVERFEVRFGEIRIEGNTRTSTDLIRDVLRFEPGDVYRPSTIDSSQQALMELGVFTTVTIQPESPELPERMKPVIVTVTERDPNYVAGSAGISTGEGIRAAAEYTYRNVFGYALSLTARARAGFQFFFQDEELRRNIEPLPAGERLEWHAAFSASLPQLASIDNVRTTFDLVGQRDNERAFGLWKAGVVLSFDWRPLRWLSFLWSNEFEFNEVQLFGNRESIEDILDPPDGSPVDPRIVRLLRVPAGQSLVVSSRIRGSIEQRDSPFVPTEGWFLSGTAEWVHSLDTEAPDDTSPNFYSHFLKLGFTSRGYIPIEGVVIAGELRLGGIVHLEPSSDTYPNRQYFLGGVDSLRGLNQDQLQPQDIADFQLANPEARTGTVLQGGDFFYLVRVEVRIPFWGPVQIAFFTDLGNHWADPGSIQLDENFVRPTVGGGVRLATPVGPIALDIGGNILQRAELREPNMAAHLSFSVF
jgi:outer membrane protein insertion porin family